MGILNHIFAGVLAVSTWFFLRMQTDFGPLDVYFPPVESNATIDGHFTETYYHARALFRKRASSVNAELHALPLAGYADLTVDVAVIKGDPHKVIVHLSGTHGVEGFAGSAIQSSVLANWTSKKAGPTVVFVHAVNPFGFSQLRRFNEHNVDLNRNWLSDAQFEKRREVDPNKSGYMDVYKLLNPTLDYFSWENWYWVRAVFDLVTKGFDTIKKGAISANYRMPEALYYGGSTLEPSLAALRDFLTTNFDFATITKLGVIDVHTGLGDSGVDTLIIMPGTTSGVAERVFKQEYEAGNAAPIYGSGNAVVAGCDDAGGFVSQGIADLLPSPSSVNVVTLAQEFGTLPPMIVLKAVVQENAYLQHAPSRRLPYAERLRDVFYTHASASWRESIVVRGVNVFDKLLAHVSA